MTLAGKSFPGSATSFSDGFAYGSGDLVGQGGWTQFESDPSPVVGVAGVEFPAGTEIAAVHAMPRDFAAPWSATYVIKRTVTADDVQVLILFGGDPTGDNWLATLTWHAGDGALDQIGGFDLADPVGGVAFSGTHSFATGVDHQVKVTYDGAVMRGFIDGVEVVSLTPADTSLAGAFAGLLQASGGDASDVITMRSMAVTWP